MTTLHLTTFIAAPAERVFDLSRSVRLHKLSMKDHHEEIMGGTHSGLMENGDTVTWKARHLLKNRLLKVRIIALEKYASFIDEQVEGDFEMMKHEHHFKPVENGTIMIDYFYFTSPYGGLGYLAKYMRKLLEKGIRPSNNMRKATCGNRSLMLKNNQDLF